MENTDAKFQNTITEITNKVFTMTKRTNNNWIRLPYNSSVNTVLSIIKEFNKLPTIEEDGTMAWCTDNKSENIISEPKMVIIPMENQSQKSFFNILTNGKLGLMYYYYKGFSSVYELTGFGDEAVITRLLARDGNRVDEKEHVYTGFHYDLSCWTYLGPIR